MNYGKNKDSLRLRKSKNFPLANPPLKNSKRKFSKQEGNDKRKKYGTSKKKKEHQNGLKTNKQTGINIIDHPHKTLNFVFEAKIITPSDVVLKVCRRKIKDDCILIWEGSETS
jgi:hypothetical protein